MCCYVLDYRYYSFPVLSMACNPWTLALYTGILRKSSRWNCHCNLARWQFEYHYYRLSVSMIYNLRTSAPSIANSQKIVTLGLSSYLGSVVILTRRWYVFCYFCYVMRSMTSPVMWPTSNIDFICCICVFYFWVLFLQTFVVSRMLEVGKNILNHCGRRVRRNSRQERVKRN